jgi:2-isopropylmalate synthase
LQEKGLEKLDDAARRQVLDRIKQLEYEGYEVEAAEGTFELIVREVLQPDHFFFELEDLKLTTEKKGARRTECTAEMTVRARDGIHTARVKASGPFHALAQCLRKCLSQTYPSVAEIRPVDYKVRVLEPNKGTAAKVRVLVEWSDHKSSWVTVGVSDDVLEASWNALVDSIRLELLRLAETDTSMQKTVEDYCWGV